MNKQIYGGLATGRTLSRIIALILLTLAGRLVSASGQTLTNLWEFTGGSDGANPYAALVQGSDGNFYGTTQQGGNTNINPSGYGIVFRISQTGSLTNLHSFGLGDGAAPNGLVQGSDGNFYGTTEGGGSHNAGTVFRISPSGSFTNLHSFNHFDGANPYAGLVQGSDGNSYGTTGSGGNTNLNGGDGWGTVFRISPSGSFTNLHSFSYTDGGTPNAGLCQGSDGNFYSTTEVGGTGVQGTVFRISPSGSFTNLHTFTGLSDGGDSTAGLVPGSDGNFYGTASSGGGPLGHGLGTVFQISPNGTLTNLWVFTGGTNGQTPYAGLVQGSDDNFYGTTLQGGMGANCGPFGCGTVFRISPSGSLTNLHSFNSFDGAYPYSGLVQGSDGNFYGMTEQGGAYGNGTVFKLIVPLSPPANQISAVHIAVTNIIFSIPSIAGETYQLQFTSSMNPTNWVNVPVSVTNSIGALLTVTNFGGASQPQGFYRFDITP